MSGQVSAWQSPTLLPISRTSIQSVPAGVEEPVGLARQSFSGGVLSSRLSKQALASAKSVAGGEREPTTFYVKTEEGEKMHMLRIIGIGFCMSLVRLHCTSRSEQDPFNFRFCPGPGHVWYKKNIRVADDCNPQICLELYPTHLL